MTPKFIFTDYGIFKRWTLKDFSYTIGISENIVNAPGRYHAFVNIHEANGKPNRIELFDIVLPLEKVKSLAINDAILSVKKMGKKYETVKEAIQIAKGHIFLGVNEAENRNVVHEAKNKGCDMPEFSPGTLFANL